VLAVVTSRSASAVWAAKSMVWEYGTRPRAATNSATSPRTRSSVTAATAFPSRIRAVTSTSWSYSDSAVSMRRRHNSVPRSSLNVKMCSPRMLLATLGTVVPSRLASRVGR
jgi:hypothetical protein